MIQYQYLFFNPDLHSLYISTIYIPCQIAKSLFSAPLLYFIILSSLQATESQQPKPSELHEEAGVLGDRLMCPKHSNEESKIYCVQCRCHVCVTCKLTLHEVLSVQCHCHVCHM